MQTIHYHTQKSYIETLTFQSESGFEVSDKWGFRLPQSLNSEFSVGHNFRFWLNEYRDSTGAVQDPTVLASNLTFDYLNDTEHTVDDLWDGWLNTPT